MDSLILCNTQTHHMERFLNRAIPKSISQHVVLTLFFFMFTFFFFFKSCKAYHLARQKLQSAVSRSRHASSSIVKQVLKIIFPQQKNISELKHSHPHRLLPVAAWQESSWNILGKKSNKSNTNSLLAGFYLYKITVRYNEQINNKAY